MNDLSEHRAIEPLDVFPHLAKIYARLDVTAATGLRVGTGLLLVSHGALKFFGNDGISGMAGFLESMGLPAPTFLALLIVLFEFFGGILLALGVLTCPAAAAIAVFMAMLVNFHRESGFFWNKGGFEYPVLWGRAALFFAIRGGGAYSVGRASGKEF